MKTLLCTSIFGFTLLFLGCPVRSLQPLLLEKDVVFDPNLLGQWAENGESFTFQQWGKNGYRILWTDAKDTVVYRAQLGGLGKAWFLDSFPPDAGKNDYHLLESHLISQIWTTGDTLRISLLEGDWLREMIDAKRLAISHVRRDSEIILTASTEELQKLVVKYANDAGAFAEPGIFIRRRQN